MAMAIENTFKEAGFTDGQAKALTNTFEQIQTFNHKNLITQLENRLIKWMLGFILALAMLIFVFIYTPLNQRIDDVNQRIDDLSADISEMRTIQASMQKEIQEMKLNQANMQRDIQDIKALLEKRAISSENH